MRDRATTSARRPAIAVSPDGRNVYAAGTDVLGGNSLLTFDRNPATGQLTQKDGLDGSARCSCSTAWPAATSSPGRPLGNPTDIAISPDGSSLYVANAGTS